MKTKYIVYSILLIGIVALIFYRINANSELKAPKSASSSTTTVKGLILHPQKFNDNISLSGTIEANEQIEIRSEVSGVVEHINFQEGSKVAQGQILFKVNDIELQAQLSKVQTAQKLAAENERRAKLLLEKQAISQEEYDIVSADFQSASAESQLIKAQLSKTMVRAPFSGTIGLRSISKGTYVTPVTPIAKLVNTSKLKLTFSIPEKYSSQVTVGSNLTFTTSDSKAEYEAKVYAIEPEVEIATRTLKMRAIAENKEGKLYPGTYANVMLPLEHVDDALMVPSESLIPVQNGKRIFISEAGKAKEIDVEIGARTGNEVRVLTGLKAGDTILTYGVMALKNGTPVKVDLNQPETPKAE
ncbi:efflux RND transporter periplasmic adaptor subunit [Maribacter hydrothermalis]|uniref:Efflux transporter periplasmic adaptor subunit n=1 Tax=Maribacter hydrothermalis TaxID=1836467 RepID=A0A1B7Z047_9FLAO|nr:efflux RND transporter periplasmic adaptor subunit [Maribacter hydrothermalis]APQ19212.1 efflux transporter periplasmic adaptor subunit [Maribacter hydrothermalis]OBR36097.1 efflux transporter periplasmic adaptor subunit [Maribacter hydrothermalis]